MWSINRLTALIYYINSNNRSILLSYLIKHKFLLCCFSLVLFSYYISKGRGRVPASLPPTEAGPMAVDTTAAVLLLHLQPTSVAVVYGRARPRISVASRPLLPAMTVQ